MHSDFFSSITFRRNDVGQQRVDDKPVSEVKSIFEIVELYNNLPENGGIYFKNRNHYNLDCLMQLIGKERFIRICSRPELDIPIDSEEAYLKKQNLRKIFIGMLDLRREDCQGSPEKAYPFNTEEELNSLFLQQIPRIGPIDKAKTSGKGLQGFAERVYIQGLHHLYINANKDETGKFLCDGEMLTSRLADREMEEGSILHLSDGYFVVDKTFIAGGAYVSALQDLNDPTRSKLVCRGTAMRYSATGGLLSGINDLLVDVGLMGTKSVWPFILAYLQEKGIKETEIFGKSLGGAQAQQLAVLVEGIAKIPVTKLTTFGAVGTSERVHQLFNKVRENQDHEIKISVVRNGGAEETEHDFIPTLGGMHLGVDTPKSTVTVYYLNEDQEPSVPFSGTIGLIAAKQFLSSFGIAHCRQITLQQFNWIEITEPEAVKEQLAMGTYLDPYRRVMATALDYLSLGYLNGSYFDRYYAEQINLK